MDEAKITIAHLDSAAETTQNWMDFRIWLLRGSRAGLAVQSLRRNRPLPTRPFCFSYSRPWQQGEIGFPCAPDKVALALTPSEARCFSPAFN